MRDFNPNATGGIIKLGGRFCGGCRLAGLPGSVPSTVLFAFGCTAFAILFNDGTCVGKVLGSELYSCWFFCICSAEAFFPIVLRIAPFPV